MKLMTKNKDATARLMRTLAVAFQGARAGNKSTTGVAGISAVTSITVIAPVRQTCSGFRRHVRDVR